MTTSPKGPTMTLRAAKTAACQLITCPTCNEPAGKVCRTAKGHVLTKTAHPTRLEAFIATQA